MASDLKTILFEDVLKHTKSKDCWLVINGKVYDVSEFMDEHPGGDDVMLATTGKDASDDFEDTGHSDYAKGLMKQFCIGEIDMSTVPNRRAGYVQPQETHIQEKSSGSLAKILQFLLPLVILGLALAIRSYTKDRET